MAGDWIKMRVDLVEDPAVIAMASALKIDEYGVVGRLHKLWSWADKHCSSGHAKGVTFVWIDRYIGHTGFAKSMADEGWLVESAAGIEFPKFDRHNGKSAKTRAEATDRKRIERLVTQESQKLSQKTCDISETREEKRREEKNKDKNKDSAPTPSASDEFFAGVDPQVVADFKAMRIRHRAPITQTVITAFRREADKAGMTIEAVLTLCCVRNWRGFQAAWVTEPAQGSAVRQSPAEKSQSIADRLTGRNRHGSDNRVIDITPA